MNTKKLFVKLMRGDVMEGVSGGTLEVFLKILLRGKKCAGRTSATVGN